MFPFPMNLFYDPLFIRPQAVATTRTGDWPLQSFDRMIYMRCTSVVFITTKLFSN